MPNYFVPVATVPYDERYSTVIRPALFPVRGVFFQRSRGELGASNLLGAQLIGEVLQIGRHVPAGEVDELERVEHEPEPTL